jgi:hypothetical protein
MLGFVVSSMLAMGLGLTIRQIIEPLRNALHQCSVKRTAGFLSGWSRCHSADGDWSMITHPLAQLLEAEMLRV